MMLAGRVQVGMESRLNSSLFRREPVLKFEHVVVVNDPEQPSGNVLSREEVWFGLLCRAEDPRPFLPGLEQCLIVERCDGHLRRRLDFGAVVIEDEVSWVELESVTFASRPTEEHVGGVLTISIEQHAEHGLQLRFAYRTSLSEETPDYAYADFVKSAYQASDLDTVRVIRQLSASGRLQ